MSANANLSDVDFPDVFSNDELAANLQKCAILVKKGEKDPLIRQTIHDLTFYLTGKRVGGAQYNPNASNSSSNHLQSSPTPSTLSKHSHKTLTGVLGKMVGLTHDNPTPIRSEAHKLATSSKNAERAKADLAGLGGASSSSQEWCTIHSVASCQCKNRKTFSTAKPPFQRPTNPKTALIANGWIEQQRRSRMRTVWKEVLASLVEGRKPGEETTLWIQREVVNPTTGKTELEALHQIPVKWLQQVTYHNYSTDHRFSLKVYNLQEEFVFRCEQSQEAAQDWVVTLQSMQEIARKGRMAKLAKTGLDDWDKQSSSFEDEKKAPDHGVQSHRVAHATPQAVQGISQQQQAAAQQHAAQQAAAQQAAAQQAAAQQTAAQQATAQQAAAAQQSSAQKGSAQQAVSQNGSAQQHATTTHRMTVHELRAIAHGAGVVTHGMERGELEHVVQQIAGAASAGAGRGPPPPAASPPATNSTNPASPSPSQKENVSQSTASEADARRKSSEERQQLGEEATRRQKLAEEAARSRAALEAKAKAEEEKRRAMAEQSKQQQEAEKRRKEEEDRQRLEAERKLREDEEHRRRVAELQAAEQRRRLEEQQRQQQAQWQQQQQQWQKQQEEDEQRRHVEEQRVAEERRRQEEAYRMQHQQWQQQQQRAQAAGVPPQQWQGQPVPPTHPHHFVQQPPPFAPGQVPPHPGAGPPPPPPGSSPVNLKYAKMAAQTDDSGQRTLQIKHSILVEWALQPPAMQILRPIERLITTIHSVFPPKFGVAGHDHFTKWTEVTMPEVLTGAQPDDEKLKKIMRKLRFFLHPDKLPRDFSEEQTFMCKMLWDITSDAFEDHKKKEEELGWMR